MKVVFYRVVIVIAGLALLLDGQGILTIGLVLLFPLYEIKKGWKSVVVSIKILTPEVRGKASLLLEMIVCRELRPSPKTVRSSDFGEGARQ